MNDPFSTYKVFRFLIIFAGVSGIVSSLKDAIFLYIK